MAQWGKIDQQNNAPIFTTNATTGESGQDEYGKNVFGIDANEGAALNGPASPGWVRIVQGTGGRAGRRQYETLVASRHMTGSGSGVPVNTVAPAISGTPVVGNTLSVSNGTWTQAVSYAYQWLRDSDPISGATLSTYELVADDANTMISAVVTATNPVGSASEEATPVGPVAAA